jgi:beta-glucosidase
MDAQLGVNAYRMGIEWSRLQSEAAARFNQAELARYVDQLDQLNAAGIVPMVVLHHFSNPPWINAIGGWTNAATIPAFVDYVTKAGRRPARSMSAFGIRSMNPTPTPLAVI